MAEKCPKKEVLKLLPQKGSYRFTRVLRYERPRQKRSTRLKWPKYGLNGLPRENGRKWITARFSSFPYYLRSIFGFRTLVDGVAGVTLGRAWLRSFPYYSCFRELSSEVQVKYVSFLSVHVACLIFSLLSYQIVYIKSEAIYLESSTYMAHNLVLNWNQHMRTGNMVRHASTGVARSQTEFSLETGGKGGHKFRALYAI